MRFINLSEGSSHFGSHDLPEVIFGENNRSFHLKNATLSGGNGVVFKAEEYEGRKSTGVNCAVKLLKQLSQPRVDRFSNEIRVLRELNCPYISKYINSGFVTVASQQEQDLTRSIPWVAMQLGGLNMRQHVQDYGPLKVPQLKAVAYGLVTALEHLHSKGFIHRDIKPENFVWRTGPESNTPMMIDFGLAKRQGEDVSGRPMDTFTQMTEFVGPVFFSSPELIEYARDKTHKVDHRSDIFQLGKVLWFLGTGKISAGVPARRECPAGGKLRDLVLDMIDDDPACRPQNLSQVLEAMRQL